MSEIATWIRVVAVGAASGGRSATPLAMESWAASTDNLPLDGGKFAWLANPTIARLLALSALSELVLDKSSLVPFRTEPGPFAGRLAFGGLAGAVMAVGHRRPALIGAAIGAAAAGVSTPLSSRLRQSIDHQGFPDPLVALGEDLIVLTVSRAATRSVGTTVT